MAAETLWEDPESYRILLGEYRSISTSQEDQKKSALFTDRLF
jgi:hypothetical protein